MRVILCVVLFIFTNPVKGNITNVYTYEMAMRCKEHICRHGYSYETFYRVEDRDTPMEVSDPHTIYEMHLAIQASSNGHILLSEVASPTSKDPVYEIVVGGGSNRFTELRRNLRRNAKASAKTVDILSTIEMRGFYIKISAEGVIEFGREGDTLPLVSYSDMSPLSIKHFSFAAWNGVEAKFLYDCPIPGSKSTAAATADSQPEEPKLAGPENLKRTLLMGRLPSIPPSPTVPVKIGVSVHNVHFNPFDSKLITRMAVVTSWTDNSMAWDPNKFNGTTNVKFRQGQIWKPSFHVLNANDISVLDVRNPDYIYMVNSGEATFHFQTKIISLCSDNSGKMNNWPRDEYYCSIIIQPWEVHERINLTILSPDDNRTKMFETGFIRNQWEVSANANVIELGLWNRLYTLDDNQTHQSDRLLITISIKRQAGSYNIVFYTPLIVLIIFVLMSFWSEPLHMSRIWFYIGCIVFISMGLCFIDALVPTHTIPSILVFYTTVLAGVLVALLLHVALISTIMDKLCNTTTMQKVLTSRILRNIFCLPPTTISVNGDYIMQEDEDQGPMLPEDRNREEMEKDKNNRNYKLELAYVVDKCLFAAYSLIFAIMLAAHY